MVAFLFLLFSTAGIHQDSLSTQALDERINNVRASRSRCGPTAVWYCLRRLGQDVPSQEVLNRLEVGSEGVSVKALLELCSSFEVTATVVSGSQQNLDILPIPSILIINSRHCVVYEGISDSGQKVRVFEPAFVQMRTVSMEELQKRWTGEAIVFSEPAMSLSAFILAVLASMAGVLGVVVFACQRRHARQQLRATEALQTHGSAETGR